MLNIHHIMKTKPKKIIDKSKNGIPARIPIKTINQAIIDNYGIITAVCDSIGIGRTSLYDIIKKHPQLQETLNLSRERMVDTAESQLMKNIKDGKETSLIFFLKCLGKQRGYVDKQEIEINQNIRQIVINVPDTETRQLLDQLNFQLIDKKEPPLLDEYNSSVQ